MVEDRTSKQNGRERNKGEWKERDSNKSVSRKGMKKLFSSSSVTGVTLVGREL
jgi:hypothetical protein